MQLTKQKLGELIIARNKLVRNAESTDAVREAITAMDDIIVSAISGNLGADEITSHTIH